MSMDLAGVPYQAYKSKRHSRNISLLSPQNTGDQAPSTVRATLSSFIDETPASSSHALELSDEHFNAVSAPSDHHHPTVVRLDAPPPIVLDPSATVASSLQKPSRAGSSKFRHVPFPGDLHPSQPSPDTNGNLFSNPTVPSPPLHHHMQSGSRSIISTTPSAANLYKSLHSSRVSSPSISFTEEKTTPRLKSINDFQAVLTKSQPESTLTPHTTSAVTSNNSHQRHAPYRPGFQPNGFYRHRTDEYLIARENAQNDGKVERQRLERRLEKIINLHFVSDVGRPKASMENRKLPLFDLGFSDLRDRSTSDIWRDILVTRLSTKDEIRLAEKAITPWQNDKDVSICPLCKASFHRLSNRKHHCRICGRVICSLPVKPLVRTRPCSVLFTVDVETGRVEEREESVDYGVSKKSAYSKPSDEKVWKGVRICQDCRHILLRKQYKMEAQTLPAFARLYYTLIALEEDMSKSLTAFKELIADTENMETLSVEALSSRQRLLESFAEYQTLAKRIRNLPTTEYPANSQTRIQNSIAVRASLYLQTNMIPLKVLPKRRAHPNSSPPGNTSIPSTSFADSLVTDRLQPLLEQEIILESFIEEARSKRKFDDMKSLALNLEEIQREIESITRENQI